MADIIGRQTEKDENEGKYVDPDYHNDPTSNDWRKYVIGKDGSIYETNEYKDGNEYIHCNKVEEILNDKFVLDENLSYTNIKIAIDDKYDEWYKKIKKLNS